MSPSSIPRYCSIPRRKALFALSPFCAWCGEEVHEDGPMDETRSTLDHVLCRAQCQTVAEYRADSNTRLSCNRCNQARNVAFVLSLPRRNRYIKLPRRVKPRALTAFDRPVASWRY